MSKLYRALNAILSQYIIKDKGRYLLNIDDDEFRRELESNNIGFKNFFDHSLARKASIEISVLAYEEGKRKAGELIERNEFICARSKLFNTLNKILVRYILNEKGYWLLDVLEMGREAFRKELISNGIGVNYNNFFRNTSERKASITLAIQAFDAGKITRQNNQVVNSENHFPSDVDLQNELNRGIELSKEATSKERKSRLNKANKYSEQILVKSIQYKRNPDVVIEVLERAKGICERCNSPAPFMKAKDNSPYLEIHHILQLANGGEDTVKNAMALCPSCHRELHFGKIID